MRRSALAFIFLATLISGRAHAHGVDPDGLIVRGLDLRRAGKPAEALELFRQAHLEAPSPRTLGQMGLVETSLSRWIDADTHLSAALATPGDGWVHRNGPFLQQALDRAKTHIGEVAVSGRPGTAVFFAGKIVGALPLAVPLRTAEGDFVLTATAAGFKPVSVNVSVKGGARTAVTIVLEPVDVAPTDPTSIESSAPAGPPPSSARRWTGVALGATGIAALTWGIVWIAVDNQNACGPSRPGGCRTVYDTKTAGWILAAGGGAFALAGSAILFSTLHTQSSELALGVTPKAFLLQARF